LVRNLKAQGVTHIFGVPGAKVDRVFDALLDSGIETVVCRHEQNASFIAQGLGRMTGRAGVCLVTSGPGTTNLVTGFATATSEGSPVVGFGGGRAPARSCRASASGRKRACGMFPCTATIVPRVAIGGPGQCACWYGASRHAVNGAGP